MTKDVVKLDNIVLVKCPKLMQRFPNGEVVLGHIRGRRERVHCVLYEDLGKCRYGDDAPSSYFDDGTCFYKKWQKL